MTPADRLAVIDVGSNSLRLFLCEGIGPDGPRGERETTVIGLRRGAAEDGTIAPDALERLDQTLAGYAESIDRFRPARTLPVATSATRDAPNRDAVASVVEGRLRAPMRILSGEEEAAVSFAGARLAVDGDGSVLVVDVGGGSTELVRGGPSGPEGAISLQLGAVRQTERHLAHDPPRSEELVALRAEARALIGPAIAAVGGPAPVVGVAGTATSLAAIDIRAYDRDRVHRRRLTLETVDRIAARLAAMTVAERRSVPGLDPERAGVIVAGALIVAEAVRASGASELMISETDLLDGVALAAIGSPNVSLRL
jgi:exopolyphosphatase / guanosine-5'-triphosphate,3'-diphosphate pyrophosphatase